MKAGAASPQRLFAYGTLMIPDVLRAVCGAVREARPAVLPNHARYRVRDHVFPGMVPMPGACTDGVIFDRIDSALWCRLDAFESPLYQRVAVTVVTPDDAGLSACAYLVAPDQRHILSAEAWSPVDFAAHHLAAYLARYT